MPAVLERLSAGSAVRPSPSVKAGAENHEPDDHGRAGFRGRPCRGRARGRTGADPRVARRRVAPRIHPRRTAGGGLRPHGRRAVGRALPPRCRRHADLCRGGPPRRRHGAGPRVARPPAGPRRRPVDAARRRPADRPRSPSPRPAPPGFPSTPTRRPTASRSASRIRKRSSWSQTRNSPPVTPPPCRAPPS